MRQQRIVFFEVLAEAKAGIEHDARALYAALEGDLQAVRQIVFYNRSNVGFGWKSSPLLRLSASVHQHHAALQLRTGAGHLHVPLKGADVVDDFSARVNGGP